MFQVSMHSGLLTLLFLRDASGLIVPELPTCDVPANRIQGLRIRHDLAGLWAGELKAIQERDPYTQVWIFDLELPAATQRASRQWVRRQRELCVTRLNALFGRDDKVGPVDTMLDQGVRSLVVLPVHAGWHQRLNQDTVAISLADLEAGAWKCLRELP